MAIQTVVSLLQKKKCRCLNKCHNSLFIVDFTNTSVNLLACLVVHPICGNLPSAVICLKSTFRVFVPHYSLFAMTYDACRKKVKWGNHSRLKKTERETSIHFQQFINNSIIPLPQRFFCHFRSFCWVTNPYGRVVFNPAWCVVTLFAKRICPTKMVKFNTNLLW